jgi:hypothetical protein
MLTIMIIFTLLVALWGHSNAIAPARARRHRGAGDDGARTQPAATIASRGH